MGYNYDAVTGDASFDANISGGTWLTERMIERGAAHWGHEPLVAWDTLPERSDDNEDEYNAALDVLTAPHGDGPPGIPAWKIAGTNDGWLVTPDEIRAALKALDKHGAPAELPEFWARWVTFLRTVADMGFRTW